MSQDRDDQPAWESDAVRALRRERAHAYEQVRYEAEEHAQSLKAFEASPTEVREDLILCARVAYEAELARVAAIRGKRKPGPLSQGHAWLDAAWKALVWRETLAQWRRSSSYAGGQA